MNLHVAEFIQSYRDKLPATTHITTTSTSTINTTHSTFTMAPNIVGWTPHPDDHERWVDLKVG